ncbi:tyrosine-type recombinase/integrase [Agathobacter sp.]|uniref:tyrosine-type recombinase/integrase n=1 Tax=Agathobacter sp. TaxID=2021311 RepID=UPI003FD7F9A9
MSKKGENIYKRKDGRWEGRYIRLYDENGKAKYGYVYGKNYSDVKQRLLEKKAYSGSQADMDSKCSALYSEVLDAWLQSTRINIKESSYARYSHLIDTHIRSQLGKYQISKISTQLIEGFIENLLSCGRVDNNGGLSAKTVTDILTIVKSTIDYARYNNLVVSCNLSKLTIKKKDKEMRVLCQSEQDALIRVLIADMDLYKFGVLLSLYTGIRIGELCALQWEDLSITNSTLKVRKTMQRIQETNIGASSKTKIIITEPKSDCSIRDIPLPSFLVEIARQFRDHPEAYILSGERGKYIEPRTMQNRFKTYVKESGISDANFHSLRHTFATRCVEVGFELKSLSEVLGHSNVNITLNRYVHSSFELKYSNMNKLAFI